MITLEQDTRIQIVRNAIDWLEKRAAADRNLVPPHQQDIYLTHEQLMFENMRMAQNPTFDGETQTQKNLKVMGQVIDYTQPTPLVSYERELKKFEDHKRERDKNKRNRIKNNNHSFFLPAQNALKENVEAIHHYADNEEEAIDKFYEAMRAFPKVTYDQFENCNPPIFSIWYNLGVSLFNSGYFEEGLQFLSEYFANTNEGDFFHDQLQQILNIDESYSNRKRMITINFEGIHFTRARDGYTYHLGEDKSITLIDLPFKHPISLNIENKDKDNPKLLDYFYLNQILSCDHDLTCYEIVLPLNKMPIFMEEFFPSIENNPSVNYRFAKDPEILKNNLIVAESRETTRKWYDEPSMEGWAFSSVVFLYIPEPLTKTFYEDYRQFIKTHISHEQSDTDLEELELEKLKEHRRRHEEMYREHLKKDFEYEQEHHRKVAKIYADLKVLEENLTHNNGEPFDISENNVHRKHQNTYLKRLDSIFDYREIIQNNEIELIDKIQNSSIRDEKLKVSVFKKLDFMTQLVDVDPYAALGKIRGILEEILYKIFEQKGYSLYKYDGTKLTPTLMANELYKEDKLPRELINDISNLHTLSKNCSHFGDRNYQFWLSNLQSRPKAENSLKKLNAVILRLAQMYSL